MTIDPNLDQPVDDVAAADDDVVVAVDIDADTASVWDAITSDDGLGSWLGTGAHIDPEPGGAIEAPDIVTGRPRRGRVDTIEPGERISFTWWPEDRPDERTNVTFVVEPGREHTRLTVIETLPGVGVARASGAWGWRTAMLAVGRRSPVFV